MTNLASIEDTYKGVSGYIYLVDEISENTDGINICDAVTTSLPAIVTSVEFVEDAYSEILEAADSGLIKICRYEAMSTKMLAWIENTIKKEYIQAKDEPDYKYFLNSKFDYLKFD